MATNGESAARWLLEQGDKTSPERLQQIRDNLANKLEPLDESATEYGDLLDALDVMDNHLARMAQGIPAAPTESVENPDSEAPQLDSSPLIANDATTAFISAEERRAKFAQLLKAGRLPPEID